ncbi:MAG: phosphoribosylglycinamide formyltransferase [Trueperaceae bacterium]|nr:phosphoribosylglycinamide formyltransferase [Trueperaceae bacterium]
MLASGRGSNLASLLNAFPPASLSATADHEPPARVVLVASNVPGAPALGVAETAGADACTIPWTRHEGDRLGFERALQSQLDAHGVDLICLAGFMRILSPTFTQRWAGRIVNVHPSLLPAYRGLHAQRQALEAGATTSGCTIHLVDAGVDTGRVVLQRQVPVLPGDDEATLADRILEQEHLAYPEAVRRLLRGQVEATDGTGTERERTEARGQKARGPKGRRSRGRGPHEGSADR